MAAGHLRPADASDRRGGGRTGPPSAGRVARPRTAADRHAAHDLTGRAASEISWNRAMLAKFLPYLRAHRWQVVWALGQVFVITGFELLKPWPLQIVIDHVLGDKTPSGGGPVGDLLSLPKPLLLALACAGVVFVNVGAGVLTLWHNYTTIRVGQNMVNDLRGDLYAHLQRLSLAYHGRQRVGDLMYRITADSFAVQTMIMNGVLPILSAIILLGGMLIVLFPIDPTLTLLSLSIVPILFALISGFNRKIVEVATVVRDLDSRV